MFPERWRPAALEGSDVEKEIALLKRRWGEAMQIMDVSSDSKPLKFNLTIQPTDPDFSFELDGGLLLCIVLPEDYPQSPCQISVLNENLTTSVRNCLERAIRAQTEEHRGSCGLRTILRWIDRQMQLLFECALEVSSSHQPNVVLRKPASSAKPTEPANGEKANDDASSAWTAEQQQDFEQALRSVPQELDPQERWARIAELVPGRTKRECVARFKELRAACKPAGGGAGAAGTPEATTAGGKNATPDAALAATSGGGGGGGGGGGEAREWSAEEQAALEKALRAVPPVRSPPHHPWRGTPDPRRIRAIFRSIIRAVI